MMNAFAFVLWDSIDLENVFLGYLLCWGIEIFYLFGVC